MRREERNFILERFYNSWKINTYVFDDTDCLVDCFQRENSAWKKGSRPAGKCDMPVERANTFEVMKRECQAVKHPLVFSEQDGIYFLAFLDAEEMFYVFGPAAADMISFTQLVSYRKRHSIPSQRFQIPCVTLGRALNGLAIVYYAVTGQMISEEEILEKYDSAAELDKNKQFGKGEYLIYEIQESTEEKRRMAYRDELKWTAEIENGTRMDTRKKLTAKELEKLERIGTLSNKNALKQYEYMVVSSATLACRAAIRGGVRAYDAYLLADVFFQKASMCTDVMELLKLYTEVVDGFSSRVRNVKENRSLDLVERCRDYIARHKTKKFSLKEMAEELGKSPGYLSRLFSEQTGTALQDYALEQRLEAGANLLRYSNRSVGEIAEYLHFSSQSYFGEYFKRKYGETPAEYRKGHKVRDFKE